MDFVAIVDQVIALLRQWGRLVYRTLQRQFQSSMTQRRLEDSKIELITSQRLAPDEQGMVLVWSGPGAVPLAALAGVTGTAGPQPPCTPLSRGENPHFTQCPEGERTGDRGLVGV